MSLFHRGLTAREIVKEELVQVIHSIVRDCEVSSVINSNLLRSSYTEESRNYYQRIVDQCSETISILRNIERNIDLIVDLDEDKGGE